MSHQTIVLNEHVEYSSVPKKILQNYERLCSVMEDRQDWSKKTEEEMWYEMCFCILSANVSFELAKSCIEVLKYLGHLSSEWIINNEKSSEILFHVLSSPIFRPQKKDGSLRKYRYPKKRADQITEAAKFIYLQNNSIKDVLKKIDSDIEVRNFFALNVPGLGIKEASHFLRNIGFSDSLAILDVHMLEFLRQRSLIHLKKGTALTKKIYLKIEDILRSYVAFHKLNLAIFDLAVWYYMRNIR